MGDIKRSFTGPPARLKFEGRSYMLDPDERQAFRGVEVVVVPAVAIEAITTYVEALEDEREGDRMDERLLLGLRQEYDRAIGRG